ncbi:MAG: glycosyltransferase, partial [Nocardiopsaceae bacterium]|nr:glycosyltransferase [Nocardiopsaceae bacterium]
MAIVAGLTVGVAVVWVYLVAGHGGYWRTDVRLPAPARPPGPDRWPSVVAVVPARDEAAILPETLPTLLVQEYPGEFAVLLVDDGSTDGTGEAAARLGRAAAATAGSRLRVIGASPPPPGWAGKVWAMAEG